MKNKGNSISVPFPVRMMSSSRADSNMPIEFAKEINNLYGFQVGSGQKRNGVTTLGNSITGCNMLDIMYYITQLGDIQLLAFCDNGKIYLKNGDSWDEKLSGLGVDSIIRWAHFAGKLIVCNGVDDLVSWDGTAFSTVKEFVLDNSINLTYISTTSFSIESEEALYAVGTPVKARLGSGVYVESTVATVSVSGDVVTVTIDDSVLTSSLDEIHYEAKPPQFAYIYSAHDKLWGFGKGPLKANSYTGGVERNFVYYTSGFNDETAWHDNGSLQYINMGDKMPVDDEMVAMAVKDGMSVFFFRNQTQVWAGSDPSVSGDFTWQKTIPVGVVHGNLVVEMPNDIAFFTNFGARTLGRVLQTEQLDISDMGSEIDPTISTNITNITSSDETYRKVFTFRHDKQGWFAFNTGNESLVFQLNSMTSGWSKFDGIFGNINSAVNTPDGKLYLASGGQLYVYDEDIYDDAGADITVKWWTPWLKPSSSGKRWANKYIEVISEQGAELDITIKRFKSYNSSNYVGTQVNLPKPSDYWDETDWDAAQWDNAYPKPEDARDHFVAEVFSYALENSSTTGPLTLFGFKLYGIHEK